MKLQEGKRYIRRDGQITSPLMYLTEGLTYPFMDSIEYISYTEGGYRVLDHTGRRIESECDLIEEYGDKAEPLGPFKSLNKVVDLLDKAIDELKTIKTR